MTVSTNPSQDTLFKTIALTMVVTFVVVASTLLLDHMIDRSAVDAQAVPTPSPTSAGPAPSVAAPASSAPQPVRAFSIRDGQVTELEILAV